MSEKVNKFVLLTSGDFSDLTRNNESGNTPEPPIEAVRKTMSKISPFF